MPAEVFGRDFAFLPHDQVLSFEEIARLAAIFVRLGVSKLRITGGEPLMRRDLPVLIGYLADLRTSEGTPVDLTLTTNGSALRALAGQLASAGLQRITVSLDSLDDEVFGTMNGVDFPSPAS
jgi:cyclic pyranopterin phosphate synthase